MVPYFGGRLTFNVTDIVPDAEAVVITRKTVFSISSQGPTLKAVDGFKYFSYGETVSFTLEDAVRKETSEDIYLILKLYLRHGGFGTIGEYQVKLAKNVIIQTLVSKYQEQAQEIVLLANEKLVKSGKINPADLIRDVKFEILEKWRNVPNY